MAWLPLRNFGKYGIIQDSSDQALPIGTWSDGRNIRFSGLDLEKMLEPTTEHLLGLSGGAIWFEPWSDGLSSYVAVATATALYMSRASTAETVTYTDATRENGAYDPEGVWQSFQWGDTVIFNNQRDIPQIYDPSLGKFKDLPGWGLISTAQDILDGAAPTRNTGARCKVLLPYKGFLVALGVTESGSSGVNTCWWSDRTNLATYRTSVAGGGPPDWDYETPASLSGKKQIGVGAGPLTWGEALNENLILYSASSATSMQLVGGNEVMSFRRLFGKGCVGLHMAAEFNNQHFVVARDQIYIHDGSTVQLIAKDRMEDSFFTKAGKTGRFSGVGPDFATMQVIENPDRKEIHLNFTEPAGTRTSLVWNYDDDNFTWMDASITDAPVAGTITAPALVYTATQGWDIYVNDERIPDMQNSTLVADPATGLVIGFIEGANDAAGPAKYIVSTDGGDTFAAYNQSSIPDNWHGAGTAITAGMTMHDDGTWTACRVGPSSTGITRSLDSGPTWIRESPLLRMNNVFTPTWSPAAINDDEVTMLTTDGVNTRVLDINPATGAYTLYPSGQIASTSDSWNSLIYNGRRLYGLLNSDQIVEWNNGVAAYTSGVPSHRRWIVHETAQNMIVGDRINGSMKTDFDYTLVDLSGQAMTAMTVTSYAIETSFLDTMGNSSCFGSGNGLYIGAVQERTNGNTATGQVALFTGNDGINWSSQVTMTLPTTPSSSLNIGRPMFIVWAGGENWLLMYRGSDNINRIVKFTVAVTYPNLKPSVTMKYGFDPGWVVRWTDLESSGETWDDLEAESPVRAWVDFFYHGTEQNMYWLTADELLKADQTIVYENGAKTYFVEREHIDLDDLVPAWTTNKFKHLNQFYFHLQSVLPSGWGATANNFDIKIGWSTSLMDDPTYPTADTVNLQTTTSDGRHKWDFRSTGRYLALHMDFTATQKISMTGGDLWAEESHGR